MVTIYVQVIVHLTKLVFACILCEVGQREKNCPPTVSLQTFHRRRGCILTQLPLQHTIVDFWRLIAGSEVNTVVSIGSEVNESEVQSRGIGTETS